MINVQKAIFPGLAAGCLMLVFITSLIANPNVALASSPALVSQPEGVVTTSLVKSLMAAPAGAADQPPARKPPRWKPPNRRLKRLSKSRLPVH